MLPRSLAVLATLTGISSTDVPAGEALGRSVQVVGQAVLRVSPDQVLIQLTVDTTDDDLIRVRENGDKKAKHVAELNGLKLGKARNIQILTKQQRPFE